MRPIFHQLVHHERVRVSNETEAPRSARLAVLHHNMVDQVAVFFEVCLQRVVICLVAQATDENFAKLLRLHAGTVPFAVLAHRVTILITGLRVVVLDVVELAIGVSVVVLVVVQLVVVAAEVLFLVVAVVICAVVVLLEVVDVHVGVVVKLHFRFY